MTLRTGLALGLVVAAVAVSLLAWRSQSSPPVVASPEVLPGALAAVDPPVVLALEDAGIEGAGRREAIEGADESSEFIEAAEPEPAAFGTLRVTVRSRDTGEPLEDVRL